MGLLKDIPVEKIKLFEADFLNEIRTNQAHHLKAITEGIFNDSIAEVLTQTAAQISSKYTG